MLDWQPGLPPGPAPDPSKAAADCQRRIRNALDKWHQAEPARPESAVAVYLWGRLLLADPVPASLRLFRGMWHRETGTRWPAMVALVKHVEHGPVGIHTTFLAPDGASKAHIEPCRKTYGPVTGGAVRLGKASPASPLPLTEGIETALACQISTSWPAWACLSAHGIAAVVLPSDAQQVVIAADNDAAGLGAAARAAERFEAEGRAVRIAAPPVPGTDWADVLSLRAPGVPHYGR